MHPPTAPQNARSRRTHDAIQRAAVDLLREGGVRAVRMEQVAARAGCSRRSLYLHFPSRSALFASLVDHVDRVEGFAAEAAQMVEAPDGRTALQETARFLGRYHTRLAPILLAVARERAYDADAEDLWQAAMARWREGCAVSVRRLAAEGELHPRFADPERAVDLAWALLSVDLLDRLVHDCGWSPDAYAEALAALLESALCRP